MLYHNVRLMGSHLIFIDAVLLGSLSMLSLSFTQNQLVFEFPVSFVSTSLVFSLFALMCYLALGARLNSYHARRTEYLWDELFKLTELVLISIACATFLTEITTSGLSSVDYLVLSGVVLIGMLVTRSLMRLVIRRIRSSGKDYRSWLIVGYNDRAFKLTKSIEKNKHFGIRLEHIVDFVESSESHAMTADMHEFISKKLNLNIHKLDKAAKLKDILAENIIDEVIITLPTRSYYDEIQEMLDICSKAGLSVKFLPETYKMDEYATEVTYTGDIALITHFTGPSNHTQLAVKRFVDIIISGLGLIFLLPLFVIVSIIIKLESKGPALFYGKRIGLHGRLFYMVKFRSMVNDADAIRKKLNLKSEGDYAFKIKDDPRITSFGKIIRGFHIDELPQLWNVFVGDMSLVGPRPLPPDEAHGRDWWHRRRLSMPPGMTCYWQITGDHDMPFNQWVELDLKYIDGWSLWVDIKLLLNTLPAVVGKRGV